mgnify:CR=1 FL=1
MTSAQGLAARVGAEIADRWYIDALIGVGGSAAVYSATHRNGHRVAIKILHDELASGDGGDRLVAAFLREGAVANQVHHPGIVSVLDDGFLPDGCPFLVMELLTGRTLDGIVRGKEPSLGWREATSITRAVAEVLAEAHAVGLVHRDVKPANIFLCASDFPWFYPGRIRLLDFGIALLDEQAPLSGVLGTPAFLPPEQARAGLGRKAQGVGPHSDQWALAATALSLLRGKPIRAGDTEAELLMRTLQPLPPAASFGLVAPPNVLDVFDHALAFEPSHRYPSMAAFVEALDGALHEAQHWEPGIHPTEGPPTVHLDDVDSVVLSTVAGSLPPPPNVNLLFSVWNSDGSSEIELPEAHSPGSSVADSLAPTLARGIPADRGSEPTIAPETRAYTPRIEDGRFPARPQIRRKT